MGRGWTPPDEKKKAGRVEEIRSDEVSLQQKKSKPHQIKDYFRQVVSVSVC